jgi:hypothetical protein
MLSGVSIINCFARGDVNARYTGTDVEISVFAGGLAGYSNRPVQYSYSTGSVFADSKGGVAVYKGFAGASGALTDCYYDKDTSGHNDTGTGYTYLTTSQMKDSANYSGWDFAAIWAISGSVNNGYPYLRPAP